MSYISREAIVSAIRRLQVFHQDQVELHKKHGIDFLDNIGRRNVLMSRAQEAFLAEELAKCYGEARSDGRPGQPDIVVPSIGKEIECKITSPNSNGSFAFQTDHDTLTFKGSLDYVYILASCDFDRFAFLHFTDLTADDFFEPGNGSRGRARMKKHRGMQKCEVLFGNVVSLREERIEKAARDLEEAAREHKLEMRECERKIKGLEIILEEDRRSRYLSSQKRSETKESLKRAQNRLTSILPKKHENQIQRLQERLDAVKSQEDSFSFILEPLEHS